MRAKSRPARWRACHRRRAAGPAVRPHAPRGGQSCTGLFPRVDTTPRHAHPAHTRAADPCHCRRGEQLFIPNWCLGRSFRSRALSSRRPARRSAMYPPADCTTVTRRCGVSGGRVAMARRAAGRAVRRSTRLEAALASMRGLIVTATSGREAPYRALVDASRRVDARGGRGLLSSVPFAAPVRRAPSYARDGA